MPQFPDFIRAYHDLIYDEKAALSLRNLVSEFGQKLESLNKSRDAQYANAKMQESFGGKPKKLDFASLEKALINEYKLKAKELAEPHVEDKDAFKKIVEQHGPDADYLKELADRKEQHERRMSDPELTASQERATKKVEDFKNKQQSEKENKKQQDLEELRKKWSQNKDMTRGR